MVRVSVVLPDELDERFRKEIIRRKGYKKGYYSESVKEAIELWLNHGRSQKQ
jgi:hypothetical protein